MADEDSDQAEEEPNSLEHVLRRVQGAIEAFPDTDRASLSSDVRSTFEPLDIEFFALNGGTETVYIFDKAFARQLLAAIDPDVVKPENVSRLASRAARVGINKLSPAQIFILVLAWLILIGIPLIQLQLPPADQAILNSEAGTIGVGLGITALILQKQK